MKHLVCYSGGEGSAKVACEVARRFGTDNLVLLNHDICPRVESADIKRFKREVANYLGLPISYANMKGWEEFDQFDVCMREQAFKVGDGQANPICSSRMKTEPFMLYLKENHPDKDCIVYYGFDDNEKHRVQRRSGIMALQGYRTDYPLAIWKQRSITTIREVGIEPPNSYERFLHANCAGCLKAGMQHWYVVFCTRPDIWEKAKLAEETIGYSIIKGHYLADLEPKFIRMKCAGIIPTEHIDQHRFWADVERITGEKAEPDLFSKPCECTF